MWRFQSLLTNSSLSYQQLERCITIDNLNAAFAATSTDNIFNQQTSKPKETRAMSKLNLKPLDDRVVVEPMEAEEVTAGGIVLPDTAKEKPQRGTVLAVGPGKLLDSGERGKLSVVVGDEVIYGKYSGTEVELDGREIKILRESDILAKVVK
jgi:chaperonin GroES